MAAAEWDPALLEDDMRPRMFALAGKGEAFALATIAAADGGPRPVGSQMVVTAENAWGFLSGGCIEADVALHGRAVIAGGEPRTLVYGTGSPFVDVRLPCGGRLEVLVERIAPDEPALAVLRAGWRDRRPVVWRSDGRTRDCAFASQTAALANPAVAAVEFDPAYRLVVFGWDPFAVAIASAGAALGWETILLRPFGPDAGPPLPVAYRRGPVEAELAGIAPDAWTAVAVATHDLDLDEAALDAALRSDAGYVGVLGARRRLPERLAGLRARGVPAERLARLRAPIGLPIGAANPQEVAVSVVAEIVAEWRSGKAGVVKSGEVAA